MPITKSFAGLSMLGLGMMPFGDFESIATVTVSGTATTEVTFSSIPGTFQHLQIRGIAKRYDNSNGAYLGIRANSDTGSNYASHRLSGDGSSVSAGALASNTSGMNYASLAVGAVRALPGNTTAQLFGAFVYDILDYASTTKNKTSRGFIAWDGNGSGAVQVTSGLWLSTSAITSLTLWAGGDTFYAPSTFALYGIKA